eukprot:TRINITY_DN3664_c0_g1_i1.p1 TRINITY_DN3664_c0_g1~~TRINITY_DN3664_c0_g1_i1.p1  ORF type:complete len:279 (-),score=76.15 TRINITY_DN3664_c0_g1_i1:32-835(-)
MPKAAKSKSKQPAPAPYKAVQKQEPEKTNKNPLVESRKLRFGIGGALRKNVDLGRYVKWPKYVQLQRQRKVLYERLKVPPAIAQFGSTLEKATATNLFRLLSKYKPEDKAEKKARLAAKAAAKAAGTATDAKKPVVLKYGLNHITALVEQSKAQLVLIAHDVDPIELVVWLPALCRKRDIPFAIVKSKSLLGQLVHKKTATAVAVTGVRKEDERDFATLVQSVRASFNDKYEDIRKHWGGGEVGIKSQHKLAARQADIQKEVVAKFA